MSARFAMGRSWPGAGVRGFLDWWGAGLVAWLPARLRDALAIGNARLVLQAEGEVLRLQLWRGGAAIALAALPLPMPAGDPLAGLLRGRAKVLPRWLQVPDALGLRRLLVLPAAARDRLRDVLAFEVERQTPFSLADVLFDGRIVQVRADGQLQVELVVVPRRQYADAVAPLGGLAAQLAGIDLDDADQELRAFVVDIVGAEDLRPVDDGQAFGRRKHLAHAREQLVTIAGDGEAGRAGGVR